MKFTVQTILSMPTDGASAHLLIFDDEISILLDCGISRAFDFSKYRQKQQQLKNVRLVLISHSQLQYSGALPFLIDQLDFDPKIFYTTQSIMRYSPLNVHEQLLCLKSKYYGKKTFNRIYKIYQSIKIIKPLQKKCVELQLNKKTKSDSNTNKNQMQNQQGYNASVGEVDKPFYFTCFCAGSNMGSLAWRLSFGLVNIFYLVDYNNFSLYHINGLDLTQIIQPTDILITDTYKNYDDSFMKKTQLYHRIKQILIRFYQRNGISSERPPVAINIQSEKKLVFSCSPNQMLVEVMAVTKKVIEDMQAPQSRQKIRVIHLSSRFLQLIKSQMDYFSPYFKDTLQNIQMFFMHSKEISGRINIATFQSLESLLSNSINTKPIQIYHFGPQLRQEDLQYTRRIGQQNIADLKIISSNYNNQLCHSASKIDVMDDQHESQVKMEEQQLKKQQKQLSSKQFTIFEEGQDQAQIIPEVQPQTHQPLHGKYFSQVGFPRFKSRLRDQQYLYDDYGFRHEYERFSNRRTILDYKKDLQIGIIQPQIQKKNSTIEIMNLQFRIPTQNSNLDMSKVIFLPFFSYRTNFNSSIQLIMALKPDNVILINTETSIQGGQILSNKYKSVFNSRKQEKDWKIIKVYDINPKKYCHIQIQNELISYKVNYIPIPQERKLQKVKGVIKYSINGTLQIHLDCLQEREHLDFRLDKFYKKVKSQEIHECLFTKNGLLIDGIRIYREKKRIVLQGYYSEQYFKVRRLLYDFLKLQ